MKRGSHPSFRELVVAGCGAASLFSGFGLAYGMAVLFPTIHEELGVPYWHLAASFSAAGAIYYLSGLISGRLSDRYGARPIVLAGNFFLAACLLRASFAQSELEFEVLYIIGIGFGVGLIYVPITSAVQALCPHNGTLAAGLSSTGIGLGACFVPPATASILGAFGWRTVLLDYAVLALVTSVACIPFVRVHRNRKVDNRLSLGPQFWLLYTAQTLASLVVFVPFAHIMTWVTTEQEMSISSGVVLISMIGFGSIVGRLALGFLGPLMDVVNVGAVSSGLIAASLICLEFTEPLWVFSGILFIFGAAYGSFNALIAPLAAKVCGQDSVGQAVGALATSRAIGVLVGPWMVGLSVDWIGSYALPFAACSLLAVCSCILMLALHWRLASLGRYPITPD